MILYLDSSAIVKCYVQEQGSQETLGLIQASEVAATVVISRAEVVAAIAKAVRLGYITHDGAGAAISAFATDWTRFVRVQITENLVNRAASLAWHRQLRGYDAVHLAASLTLRDALHTGLTVATYDRELWVAAREEGLDVFPTNL